MKVKPTRFHGNKWRVTDTNIVRPQLQPNCTFLTSAYPDGEGIRSVY